MTYNVFGGTLSLTQSVWEPDRPARWIKESVHIRKEDQQAMNPDKGSYQLSHMYDRFLDTTAGHRVKIQKNWVPASSDERLWKRSKRRRFLVLFWLCHMNFLATLNSNKMNLSVERGNTTPISLSIPGVQVMYLACR